MPEFAHQIWKSHIIFIANNFENLCHFNVPHLPYGILYLHNHYSRKASKHAAFLSLQSPGHFTRQNSAYENPALTDNWDDAEGYYRK